MLKLGWFSTSRGQTSRKLLTAVQEAILKGEIDAEIAAVFCDRERGESANTDVFLDLVQAYGIPLVTFSYRSYRLERGLPPAPKEAPLPDWRASYDQEVIARLEPYGFDLAMLAGYMLVASDALCQRFDLLNLHPAAPGGPKGIWQDVIWELIGQGARESGVMIHLATPELDAGPPVTYCLYPIQSAAFQHLWAGVSGRSLQEIRAIEGEDNALFQEIRRQGVAREIPLVVETVRAAAAGKFAIRGNQLVDATGQLTGGYDLTAQIESIISAGQV